VTQIKTKPTFSALCSNHRNSFTYLFFRAFNIPCRNNKVRDGTAINSPSSTASAQAEEEDGHKQESARLAHERKQPIHQQATLNIRGAGEANAENSSQGVKKPGTRCAGKELPNKPFSDYLHLHLFSQKQQKHKMVSNLLGKRCRRQRLCAMDSSYSHISLSDKLTKNRRPPTTSMDGWTDEYNYIYMYILLPRSRIQLSLLTYGLRRTG
jgi:hypothetical protein